MKTIICNNQNLAEVIETITWSGDAREVARTLTFSAVSAPGNPHLPKVVINEDDFVYFMDNDRVLFGGPIFDIAKTASGLTINYTAFDLMFFINKSSINQVFNTTPEEITRLICQELEVPFGAAANTGISLYYPCLNKKAYEAIMAAYTMASRQNGKKYIPLIQDVNKVCVLEKGQDSGVILDGEYNLMEAQYGTSKQNLLNRIKITDENDNVIGTVEGETKYGIVQGVYKEKKSEDAFQAARSLLFGIEQTASVTAVSDVRAKAGYSIRIREPKTGLVGRFYIESDTHTFSNGKEEMQLVLAFENMMDEQEI